MNNAVFSVTEELILGDGTTVITVGDGKNSRKFTVSTRLCSQYGFIKGWELSENDIEFISELAEITRAIKKGLDLLSYSDMSKSALVRKLTARDFAADVAQSAASQLEIMGYIDEKSHALRLAKSAAKQFYGPLAISDKLRNKGFERKYVQYAIQTLMRETDFAENLRIYAEQKGILNDILSNDDPKQGQKVCASLLRRGFTFEHISQLRADK